MLFKRKIHHIFPVTFIVIFLSPNATSDTNWHPKYHIAPQKGWTNDPNGLIYHEGYYHAFFQYNPNDTKWGLMYWGHVRSKDMLTWEHLPIALSPSLSDDIDGIFSGSAVEKDGHITIIYTGVSAKSTKQKQMVAINTEDNVFKKLGVVIEKNDGDEANFRDPKAWRQNDSWFVIIGSKSDNRGEVILYKSDDFSKWTYEGILAQANDYQGYMWECPDFFTIGSKQILVVNPQGMKQDGNDYQNLYQTGYFVGTWSPGNSYAIEKQFREVDHGHDFYASQTFLAPDGRRIMIGWLGMWESQFPESKDGWAGMQSLPRELSLTKTGDLKVRPIREIEAIRTPRNTSQKLIINNSNDYSAKMDSNINNCESFVIFNLLKTNATEFGIELVNKHGDEEGVKIYVNRTDSRLYLHRNFPQYKIEASSRSVAVDLTLPSLVLDVFVDGSSIEVFVNGGEGVMSSRIYPTDDQRSLYFFATDLSVQLSYIVYDI